MGLEGARVESVACACTRRVARVGERRGERGERRGGAEQARGCRSRCVHGGVPPPRALEQPHPPLHQHSVTVAPTPRLTPRTLDKLAKRHPSSSSPSSSSSSSRATSAKVLEWSALSAPRIGTAPDDEPLTAMADHQQPDWPAYCQRARSALQSTRHSDRQATLADLALLAAKRECTPTLSESRGSLTEHSDNPPPRAQPPSRRARCRTSSASSSLPSPATATLRPATPSSTSSQPSSHVTMPPMRARSPQRARPSRTA